MQRRLPVLFFLAVAGCHHEQTAEPPSPPPGEVWITAQQSEEAKLTTAPVAEREVGGAIVTSGRITFDDLHVAHVFSPVTGRVTAISAHLGQHVKKGDPLVTIDSPDLGTASADLAKAMADVIAAEHDFKRQKELYAIKVISLRDLETSEDNYRKARAELDRARGKARLLATNGGVVGQGYVLRALIDGEVVARNVNPGQEVAGLYGGGTAVELFTIGEIDPVWALADVFEMDIARVKSGQKVSVKVVAYPDKVFEGKVDWVSGTLDPATRTAKVRCTLPNAARELKPEMFATITLGVEAEKRLAVPSTSVLRLGEQTVVFVRSGEGLGGKLRFERRPVKIADDTPGDWVPILDGLKSGEAVVNSGAILLSGT
jgi:cobalt-zinc-cadmium efflux system membrane fusion protein